MEFILSFTLEKTMQEKKASTAVFRRRRTWSRDPSWSVTLFSAKISVKTENGENVWVSFPRNRGLTGKEYRNVSDSKHTTEGKGCQATPFHWRSPMPPDSMTGRIRDSFNQTLKNPNKHNSSVMDFCCSWKKHVKEGWDSDRSSKHPVGWESSCEKSSRNLSHDVTPEKWGVNHTNSFRSPIKFTLSSLRVITDHLDDGNSHVTSDSKGNHEPYWAEPGNCVSLRYVAAWTVGLHDSSIALILSCLVRISLPWQVCV